MALVISLTVTSVNNNVVYPYTQAFVATKMSGIMDNQNTGGTAYALDVPGASQFDYCPKEASVRSDKYTVAESVGTILSEIAA